LKTRGGGSIIRIGVTQNERGSARELVVNGKKLDARSVEVEKPEKSLIAPRI